MSEMSLENIQKGTDSIYEAVVVLTKRARQINDEQKREMEIEMDASPVSDTRENEDFGEVEIDREALLREYKKYPKPTRAAIEEMVKGEIDFKYYDPDEEKKE